MEIETTMINFVPANEKITVNFRRHDTNHCNFISFRINGSEYEFKIDDLEEILKTNKRDYQ